MFSKEAALSKTHLMCSYVYNFIYEKKGLCKYFVCVLILSFLIEFQKDYE